MGGAVAGIGEALRSTRERRGLSIDQVAQDTRISSRFLEALEAEQFDELPAPVYVRGFLRSYASYLRLEPQPLLDRLVGGDLAPPGATEGYVGASGAGRPTPRRSDPFQRGGVIAPPPPRGRQQPAPDPEPEAEPEDEGWAPEPLTPFSPPPADHGYIPGSDLMEAPERPPYAEPEPVFRRTAGVLAERPVGPGDPGIPRKVIVFGGAVVALLAFLALAVFLTRGNGDGSDQAGVVAGETPKLTPGTVIPVGTQTVLAVASGSPSAQSSAVAATTGTPKPATATSEGKTPTPGAKTPTAVATATSTPTVTNTPAPAPTATPTQPPAPTATPVPPVLPEAYAFGECTATNGSYDCGPAPYRVICYPPFGYSQNSNWWVDANRSFGPVPSDWKEFDGLMSNGEIIKAGQTRCSEAGG